MKKLGDIRSKFYIKNNLEIAEEYEQGKLRKKTILFPNGSKEYQYYFNGKLTEKYTEKNYKKNGPYQKYSFSDGSLEEEGTYKNGEKNGIIKTYIKKELKSKYVYENGILKDQTEFNGHPLCQYIYKNGQPQKIKYFDKDFETTDKKKRFKDGPYQLKRENGSVWEEGKSKNGFYFPVKRYYGNGQIWNLFTRKKNGGTVEKSFDEIGRLKYKHVYDKYSRIISTEYYLDGQLTSKNYTKKNAKINEYYSNGQLTSRDTLNPDGTKISETYVKGRLFTKNTEKNYKKNGLCQMYSIINGKLESEENYSKGKLLSKIGY